MSKFDAHVDAASNDMQTKLDVGNNHAAAAFDAAQASPANRQAFRQCINTARNKYEKALNDARNALRTALRGIFR